MASRVLRLCQFGKETTHGTAVPADTKLLMTCTLPEADREIKVPNVMIGTRTPMLTDSAFPQRILADGITLEDTDGAYFEGLPIMLSTVLVGGITATEQTTDQDDYLWTFAAPQTGAETIDSITLEAADDQQAYEIGYVMGRSLSFTFDCDSGEVHVSWDGFGDKQVQTTVTGAVAVPSAEYMDAHMARLYIDDTWAGLGGTEVTGALVSGEISISGGVHPKFFGSAQREFDSHGQGEIAFSTSLTLERTSAVATEELNYRPTSTYAVAERFVRISFIGKQIGTGDTQSMIVDMAGVWTSWGSISSDRDGNTLDAVVLTGGYDSTGSQGISIDVTTTIATI